MTKGKIEIVTKLHSGIYRSSGGGQEVVRYSYNIGPRNLITAAGQLIAHRRDMDRSYGNIGCGRSWLTIDGTPIDQYSLDCLVDYDNRRQNTTATQEARELIADVLSGAYVETQREVAEYEREEYERMRREDIERDASRLAEAEEEDRLTDERLGRGMYDPRDAA